MSRKARLPRVLHLFSNCKWTGPAEPALNLCVALRELGVETDFACPPHAGNSVNMVLETARERGLEPILGFRLRKHRHPLWNTLDRRKLGKLLASGRYGLVHCHLDNDHLIATGAARRHGIPLLRSSYEGGGFPDRARYRGMLAATDFLIAPSELARGRDVSHFAFPEAHTRVVHGAVDTARFSPARQLPDARERLGLPPDALVIGIVARMQTHRHYEDLLEAFALLRKDLPAARLVVVGRGTKQDAVARQPARALGIEDDVCFTDYIERDDYVAALNAFDVGVFLVPGSDGTCRAVREIMAMGKPMVVTGRGMLPEIVGHEREGLVCDGTPAGLHAALDALCTDDARRTALGHAARVRAETAYSLRAQAEAVAACYEAVLTAR